jgi:DNA-binding transcriptional ArsR family regulator
MFREAYHPNAFLSTRRNIRPGLVARTKIVLLLEKGALNTRTLVEQTRLSYSSVRYHLRLLEGEKIIFSREGDKPYSWELTGIGQQRLTNLQKP